MLPVLVANVVNAAQIQITRAVSRKSLTVRSCLCWMRNTDQRLSVYFTAITFVYAAYKTTGGPLKDELLDVLATTCLQSNNARRCRSA